MEGQNKTERLENLMMQILNEIKSLREKQKEYRDEDIEAYNLPLNPAITVVKLKNWESKQQIMKNKPKLNGSQIYIENNMTYEERKIQKYVAKKEVSQGKTVKVGWHKLYKEGKWWKWDRSSGELKQEARASTSKN
ncbi:hypothetical protein FQR65_LT09494 [Abscondita terminalis]|nr:hypothetical protein FQR65_LT09494 [Abscondita terminalis]